MGTIFSVASYAVLIISIIFLARAKSLLGCIAAIGIGVIGRAVVIPLIAVACWTPRSLPPIEIVVPVPAHVVKMSEERVRAQHVSKAAWKFAAVAVAKDSKATGFAVATAIQSSINTFNASKFDF
jgi:hypothetical protein